jgi:hypothetical protein
VGRDQWPGLSVQISRRRWRCVPDPDLCLTQSGAAFVRGLLAHAEIWVTPEFLNILDSRPLYDREPELLTADGDGRCLRSEGGDEVRHALQIWSHVRDDAGRGGGLLHWVRDAPHESCLPVGMEDHVVQRWEAMAEALDLRLPSAAALSCGPMAAAMRDVTALAATLTDAAVLCRRDPSGNAPPLLCRYLREWRLPCRHLPADDELVERDRGMVLNLMVEAGLPGFLWAGERFVVVRLLVPGGAGLPRSREPAELLEEPYFLADEPHPVRSAWDGAQAFWYDLVPDPAHA